MPSCLRCNKSFELDDEYFKQHLALRADIESHSKVDSLLEEVKRAWKRPEGGGLTAFVRGTLAKRRLNDPRRFEIGQVPDSHRISRVLGRTVRGLLYHETSLVMPASYDVSAVLAEVADPHYQFAFEAMLFSAPDRVVAGGNFVYCFARAPEDPFATAWLLEFYRDALFYAVSAPPRGTV